MPAGCTLTMTRWKPWCGRTWGRFRSFQEYHAVYRHVLRLPSFREFPSRPEFMSVAQQLLGSRVLVHPRRIGRMSFSQQHRGHHSTPPGSLLYPRFGGHLLVLVPLGDCPVSLGGLAVWPGSHQRAS